MYIPKYSLFGQDNVTLYANMKLEKIPFEVKSIAE